MFKFKNSKWLWQREWDIFFQDGVRTPSAFEASHRYLRLSYLHHLFEKSYVVQVSKNNYVSSWCLSSKIILWSSVLVYNDNLPQYYYISNQTIVCFQVPFFLN